MEYQKIMELQNTIIENQRYIISELMGLYCMEPAFEIKEELQGVIRENNQLVCLLNAPDAEGR